MKKFIFTLTLMTLVGSLAFADVGQGGMSECIFLSVKAAIDTYSQNNSLNPVPSITIAKSDGSKSNGIDIMVSVNSQIIYYVIATPNSSTDHRTLFGCTSAVVGYTKIISSK